MRSIFLILLFLNLHLFSQENKYDDLNEFILHDETTFTILNSKNTIHERKYKALIINRFADDLNNINLYYSKFTKIVNLRVSVFDSNGKLIKKYSLKDCNDIVQDFQALATDSRRKYLKISQNSYPYIVDVEYKIENKESMFYPYWQPFTDSKQGVEKSTFTVIDKNNTGVRYKGHNIDDPEITRDATGTTYKWTVSKEKTIKPEIFSGSYSAVMPIVYLAAKDFEIEGFKGNMETWEGYASWIYDLSHNKADLKEHDLAEIKSICDNINDTIEKIKAVYNFVQRNSRYVSVQLGIGGWQPFAASFVHKNKYGDCKALSFYTQCILESLGIPAYYTLIRAGRNVTDVPEDFPVARFNHAIVTVPLNKDTLWLECTSQTNPLGYMGTFTSNRNCLIVHKNGGKLVKTKKYTEKENVQSTNVNMVIDHSGNAIIDFERKYSGIELENKDFIAHLTESESGKRKWILDNSSFGKLELNKYDFYNISGYVVPQSGYNFDGKISNFASKSAGRLFIKPFIFTNINNIKLPNSERVNPIIIKYAFTHLDTIEIKSPEGYSIEKSFTEYELKTQFGEYKISLEDKDGFLFITREFVLFDGQYPKEDYVDFRAFINAIQVNDKNQIVFVKQ